MSKARTSFDAGKFSTETSTCQQTRIDPSLQIIGKTCGAFSFTRPNTVQRSIIPPRHATPRHATPRVFLLFSVRNSQFKREVFQFKRRLSQLRLSSALKHVSSLTVSPLVITTFGHNLWSVPRLACCPCCPIESLTCDFYV